MKNKPVTTTLRKYPQKILTIQQLTMTPLHLAALAKIQFLLLLHLMNQLLMRMMMIMKQIIMRILTMATAFLQTSRKLNTTHKDNLKWSVKPFLLIQELQQQQHLLAYKVRPTPFYTVHLSITFLGPSLRLLWPSFSVDCWGTLTLFNCGNCVQIPVRNTLLVVLFCKLQSSSTKQYLQCLRFFNL